MDDMIARIASAKIAESMNQKIDSKFRTWKKKNPVTNREIGYWTLKSWKDHSQEALSDPLKKKQKEYAQSVFEKFQKAIEKDEENQEGQEENSGEISSEPMPDSEVAKLLKKKNLGLPGEVFNNNRLAIKGVNPKKKDVEKFAEEMKDAFKTETHDKGKVGQMARAGSTFVKTNRRMVGELVGSIKKLVKKEGAETPEEVKELIESNPEVRTTAKVTAANFLQGTVIPHTAALAGAAGTYSIGNAIASGVTAAAGASLVGPGIAAYAAGVGVAAWVSGQATKAIGKGVNKKKDSKVEAYDSLAADIYAGYITPEEINKEYSKRLEKIMGSDKDPKEMRDEILELWEDFDKNVRPSIDKGVYLRGEQEGADKKDYLKRGAEEEEAPILITLKMLKMQYEAGDLLADIMGEDCEEKAKDLEKILSGEQKIPDKTIKALQRHAESMGGSKKASASRVASRYLRELNDSSWGTPRPQMRRKQRRHF